MTSDGLARVCSSSEWDGKWWYCEIVEIITLKMGTESSRWERCPKHTFQRPMYSRLHTHTHTHPFTLSLVFCSFIFFSLEFTRWCLRWVWCVLCVCVAIATCIRVDCVSLSIISICTMALCKCSHSYIFYELVEAFGEACRARIGEPVKWLSCQVSVERDHAEWTGQIEDGSLCHCAKQFVRPQIHLFFVFSLSVVGAINNHHLWQHWVFFLRFSSTS